MRRAIIAVAFCAAALARAADGPEGRWQGVLRIPARDFPLVVDLAPGPAGAWTGSAIIPGLGLKGAPLTNIAVAGADVAFDLGNALRSPEHGAATFRGRATSADRMSGDLSQGGNVAPFTLVRTGAAQVEAPVGSTPVRPDFAAAWTGRIMPGDYPRDVEITVSNHENAAATATLFIVGKRRNELPVDLVVEEGEFLRVESSSNRVTFEGRYDKARDMLEGSVDLGSFELPVVLRRKPASAS